MGQEIRMSRRVLEVQRSARAEITQEKLQTLVKLQAATLRAAIAQCELVLEIERLLACGAEVEEGRYYFDSRRMLAIDRGEKVAGK